MKNRIKINFDNGSKFYDHFSEAQEFAGDLIFKEMENMYKSKNLDLHLFELGCGTGSLSKKVTQNYKFKKITLNDISSNMLKIAKKKLKGSNVKYIKKDFDKIMNFQKFDLVISNMSLHWSFDIENLIKVFCASSKKNSHLIFTFPNDLSFRELHDYKSKIILNTLPNHKNLKKTLQKKKLKFFCRKEKTKKKYANIFSFLTELKKIGVGTKLNYTRNNLFFLRKKIYEHFEVSYSISIFTIINE